MTTRARSNLTGEHRDDAGELALEAHLAFIGHRRFGGESSATTRQRGRAPAGETHELDALMAIFAGC
jgi:hypothetical protein